MYGPNEVNKNDFLCGPRTLLREALAGTCERFLIEVRYCTAGNAIAAKPAAIAIQSTSSISVKPFMLFILPPFIIFTHTISAQTLRS